MAHSLNTMEEIETKEQLDIIKDRSCEEAQCFLFSRPLAYAEFKEWLASSAEILRTQLGSFYENFLA